MMNRLKSEGKVRAIGLSAYSNEDFVRLVPKVRPAVLQSWAHAMDDHFVAEGTPVRGLLDAHKMSFIAFSPLNQGVLLGRYTSKAPPSFEEGDHRRGDARFSTEGLARVEPGIARLKERFGSTTEDLARVALQYLLHNRVVGCVIPGFRTVDQVKVNLAGAGRPLSDEDFAFRCRRVDDLVHGACTDPHDAVPQRDEVPVPGLVLSPGLHALGHGAALGVKRGHQVPGLRPVVC